MIWFFALWGASQSHGLLVLVGVIFYLFFHLMVVSQKPHRELALIIGIAIIGNMIDFTLGAFDVVVYQNAIFQYIPPLWLTSLWACFGSTYWHSFRWLQGRYFMGSILAALAAPFLYMWAMAAGAVSINVDGSGWIKFGIISLVWALFFPFTLWLSVLLDNDGGLRNHSEEK